MSRLNHRYITATFCDDVRAEVGGKFSFMGIYNESILISSESFPVAMTKLCVVVTAVTPIMEPFEKLNIRVLFDETVLAEGRIADEALLAPMPDGQDPLSYRKHGFVFTLQPFLIERDGILRVRADTEDGEIRVGGIQVKLLQSEVSSS